MKNHQVPRETAYSLRPHGITLVRHRTRANLCALKRLFDLFQVRQQAQIRGDLVRACAETRERREGVYVYLARVRLRGDWVRVGEPAERCHERVEFLHFGVIAIKEREEGGLGACRAFHATETDVVAGTLQVAQVP